MERSSGGDPIEAGVEDHPGSSVGQLAILGEDARARIASLLVGLTILILLTQYSLLTVGRLPWEIEEMLEKPSAYEGEEVVLSISVSGFVPSDPVLVEVERDGRVLSLPLRFPENPDLFRGASLSIRGESRLESQGAVVVREYHVADPRPKAVLGLLGAVLCGIYLLNSYVPVWHRIVLEPR
jgi:hypothetical protein